MAIEYHRQSADFIAGWADILYDPPPLVQKIPNLFYQHDVWCLAATGLDSDTALTEVIP
ncbi:50s ribosomal protein l31 [Photorhabdus temperata subsp. temperata M1021]|nr:50s ribosomal protein l31 [Photorhabdus temperata subsp. temperata M1021]